MLKYKSQLCVDCGVSYPPYVMDFDHLGEEAKRADVGYLTRKGHSTEQQESRSLQSGLRNRTEW